MIECFRLIIKNHLLITLNKVPEYNFADLIFKKSKNIFRDIKKTLTLCTEYTTVYSENLFANA